MVKAFEKVIISWFKRKIGARFNHASGFLLECRRNSSKAVRLLLKILGSKLLRDIFSLLILIVISLLPFSFAANQQNTPLASSSETITLDFRKIPVRELIQFLADAMHYNVIMTEAVTGNLALHFHDVTWREALGIVLEMSGLVKKEKDNVLFIGTANEFATKQKNLSDAAPFKIITVKLHHTDANTVSGILKAQPEILSSMAKINCNPRENTLWIKEKLDNVPLLLNYLSELDQAEKQILVTAKILNVDNNKVRELGIHFNSLTNNFKGDQLSISLPQTTANAINMAIANVAQNQLLNLQIDALESTGHSKLIANPKIITQNRKSAIIEAGEEIPYQESTSSGATSVSFKKAALSLKVTPTLLPDGRIILDLEINQNKTSLLAVNGTPAIQTQELKTEVIVRDQETVILGGIFETSLSEVKKQLPLFGEIPLLGSLFSTKKTHIERKELLIFVSPHTLTPTPLPR
jgi:type IV pilus assembly protein PilQ